MYIVPLTPPENYYCASPAHGQFSHFAIQIKIVGALVKSSTSLSREIETECRDHLFILNKDGKDNDFLVLTGFGSDLGFDGTLTIFTFHQREI